MVSRDRVTEQAEDVSVLDRLNSGWSVFSHALEERWVMDVGRIIAPSEEIASWSLQVVPPLVSSQSVGVEFLETNLVTEWIRLPGTEESASSF